MSGLPPVTVESPAAQVVSAYSSLRHRLFRWLFIASLASNIGTWMQNVGAAWLMTELSASSHLVALVQTATNLPVFFLVVPSGALADILDRRHLLLIAQGWMLIVATVPAAVTYAGLITPWLLLVLTFLLGLGFALNAPAWLAITPELVSRAELPAGIALNSVSMNAARAVGPALGGLVVAAASPATAFLLNAISFVGVLVVLACWKRPPSDSVLPAERLMGAMRVGISYVRYTPAMRAILIRAMAFMIGGSCLWALLPLVTRQDPSRGATSYGILLGCLGAGAVIAAGVRARGIALYLLVFFGGMAIGGVVWGALADQIGLSLTLTAAAAWAVVELLLAAWFQIPQDARADLEPSRHWPEVETVPGVELSHGPVLVTLEYHIVREHRQEFVAAMYLLRMARLRDGALNWGLFQDATDSASYLEVFFDESWVEHLRHHERVTEADRLLQEKVQTFLRDPPLVRHHVAVKRD